MRIVEIAALSNGAHRNQNNASVLPDGWAVIPEGVTAPDTFPFVGLEVEEVTHYRAIEVEKEVIKTREVTAVNENGEDVTTTEEYTETEVVTEQEPYTIMTVTGMTAGEVPEAVPAEIAPTEVEQLRADVDYIAIMTGVEL